MDFRNVKSLMIGGKPVAKLLIGGMLAWQKAKPEPEPVVEGAYIETDGQSYMDLGIVPDVSTSYEIDLMYEGGKYTGTTTLRNCAYGCATGTNSASLSHALYFKEADGFVRFAKPTSNTFTEVVPGVRFKVSVSAAVDDKSSISVGDHAETVPNTYTAATTMKFGCSYTGSPDFYATARFYSAKFWESGVLVRDLVPYSGPRGVGLLDRVHDVLYTNAGGGSLTYGVESQLPEDRLEVTFDLGLEASVGEASIPVACRNWPIDGRFVGTAYYGIGDPYEFEQEAALVGSTWKQFTNYSGDALPDRGEYTRWIYGVGGIQLNFGYILFTAPAKRCIKVLRIPTYAVMNTCTGSFPNCSDITFVGRSRAEAVAMHAGMQSAFASATWHCTDGDYVGGAE